MRDYTNRDLMALKYSIKWAQGGQKVENEPNYDTIDYSVLLRYNAVDTGEDEGMRVEELTVSNETSTWSEDFKNTAKIVVHFWLFIGAAYSYYLGD